MFYVTHPSEKRWPIILQGNHVPHSDENHDLSFDIPSTPSYTTQVSTSYEEIDTDYVDVIHNNHEERIWEN